VLLHGRARQGLSKKAEVLAETTRPREKSVEARWKHHECREVSVVPEPIDRGGWPSRLKLDIDHATLGNLAHTDATAGHAGERVGDAEPALQRV